MKELGYGIEIVNKKVLDEVILTAMRAEKDTAKENHLEADNLETMM